MKLSSQEEYGLRCLLQLARAGEGASLTIAEMSEREGISAPNVAKIMRIEIISRITPPATSSERSDRRISVRNHCPVSMNSTSTVKASADSRKATRARRSGVTLRITEMNTGRLPKGSSTSSSSTRADRKVWSIDAHCRPPPTPPWLLRGSRRIALFTCPIQGLPEVVQ